MRTVMLVLLGLVLTACPDGPTWLDEGLMVRDGLTLHVDSYPRTVCTSGELEHNDTVAIAVEQWNRWLDIETFVETPCPADIEVSQGYVPGESTLGTTALDYDLVTGAILHADVTLSSDHAYNEPTFRQVALHEIGGHTLGLEDDPGPPTTVDLRSIMSDPLDPLGVLTEHDRDILTRMLLQGLW